MPKCGLTLTLACPEPHWAIADASGDFGCKQIDVEFVECFHRKSGSRAVRPHANLGDPPTGTSLVFLEEKYVCTQPGVVIHINSGNAHGSPAYVTINQVSRRRHRAGKAYLIKHTVGTYISGTYMRLLYV